MQDLRWSQFNGEVSLGAERHSGPKLLLVARMLKWSEGTSTPGKAFPTHMCVCLLWSMWWSHSYKQSQLYDCNVIDYIVTLLIA